MCLQTLNKYCPLKYTQNATSILSQCIFKFNGQSKVDFFIDPRFQGITHKIFSCLDYPDAISHLIKHWQRDNHYCFEYQLTFLTYFQNHQSNALLVYPTNRNELDIKICLILL